jgi:hypothetical protein
MRLVSGGDGMLSSSQRDPHFGLGDARAVDELTVAWPSGVVDTVRGLAADRVDTVVEGVGLLPGPPRPTPLRSR